MRILLEKTEKKFPDNLITLRFAYEKNCSEYKMYDVVLFFLSEYKMRYEKLQ